MSELRCPGQDMRYWRPEDIVTIACPHCGGELEFWKDEPVRACPACRREVRKPRQDSGCTQWCKQSRECLGRIRGRSNPASEKG